MTEHDAITLEEADELLHLSTKANLANIYPCLMHSSRELSECSWWAGCDLPRSGHDKDQDREKSDKKTGPPTRVRAFITGSRAVTEEQAILTQRA